MAVQDELEWCAHAEVGVRASFQVSYQQLSDLQRTLFRMFGQLPGPDLSVYGAAALAHCDVPSARALLEDLHTVSLIEETVPERYQMPDPLKEYASALLASGAAHEPASAMVRLLDSI